MCPTVQSLGTEPVSPGHSMYHRCSKMLETSTSCLLPSLAESSPKSFFLSLLSETRDGAVNMFQMQKTATRVLGTKEFAPSVMGLGRRGVWEDRLSLQEQPCTISQKGKTMSKSSNSILSLLTLEKNIYSLQASVYGTWIY